MRRPDALAEVARLSSNLETFHYALAEFLDQFRLDAEVDMLAAEPERLETRFPGGEIADAYLAAVAVSLARTIHCDPPRWAWDERRKLRRPWFAHRGPALRATLIHESPAPFRERNLFVSANALSRA